MKNKALFLTIFIGILIGFISYCIAPYNDPYLFGIHIWALASLGAFIGAFVASKIQDLDVTDTALITFLGIVLALIGCIFYDINFKDETSHSMFPFEIIFCAVITIPTAFVGAYLGKIGKLKKSKN